MSDLWHEMSSLLRIAIVIFGLAALFPLGVEALRWVYRKLGMLP